jgi:phosphatidate phosphatase LPIN
MKVGDGGEAFFVFETSESIPHDLQTSPLVSPATSPKPKAAEPASNLSLAEPEPLDLAKNDDGINLSQDLGLFIGRPRSADGRSRQCRNRS